MIASSPAAQRRYSVSILAGVVALLAAPAVSAQSTWTGTSSNLWSDAGNWSAGVPGSGGTALINASTPNNSISLGGAARPIGSINFSATPAGYILGTTTGDVFNFDAGGAITNTSTSLQTIGAAINMAGALTVMNGVTGGGGQLVLSGPVILNGGTLTINNSIAGSTTSPVTTTLSGNVTDGTAPGGLTLQATTTGTAADNNFVISGANTYTGPTTIQVNTGSNGSIQIGSDSPFGTGKVTTVLVGNSPQISAINGAHTIGNRLDLTAGMTYVGTNNLTFTGPMTVINTNAGNTAGRTLSVGVTGITVTFGASPGSSTITIGNPASNGGDNAGKTLTLNAAAGGTLVMNDVLQDPAPGGGTASGLVSVTGGGTYVPAAQNTYSGATTMSGAGTIVPLNISSVYSTTPNGDGTFAATVTSGPFGIGTYKPNNGTNQHLRPTGAITIANTVDMTGSGWAVDYNSGDTTSSLTMAGEIDSTVGKFVSNGFNNNLVAGGTVFLGVAATPNVIKITSGQTLNLAAIVGPIVVNDVIRDNGGAGNLNINPQSHDDNLVVLNGPNTYSGTTTIGASSGNTTSAGVTYVGVNSVGDFGSITSGPFGTGTVVMNETASGTTPPVLVAYRADRVIANAVTMNSGFFVANAPSTGTGVSADPTGPHSLTFTGPITLGATSRVITNNMVAGTSLTFGTPGTSTTFTLGNNLVVQSQSGTAGPNGGNTIINDQLTGTGGLTVQQGGTVTLTNGNSYAGATNVTGGKLLANNGTNGSATSTGAVNVTGSGAVGSGGTLGGTGTITGTINLSSTTPASMGGTISPGNSVGTLNVASMVWNPNAQYVFEHSTTSNAVGGTTNDLINGTGTLDLSNLLASGAMTVNLVPTNFATTPTQMDYTIATFAGGIFGANGNSAAQFNNGDNVSAAFTLAGSYQGAPAQYATVLGNPGSPQAIILTFTPVPEPTAVLAACGAAFGGLAWWRRKRTATIA